MTIAQPLLSIDNLKVSFGAKGKRIRAVRGVSLDLMHGEALGIVGESGSGKSVTAMSILGLVAGATTSGSIQYDGRNLLELGQDAMREVRGSEIGMIFQDPMSSLNPIRSVGQQIEDVIRAHRRVSGADAHKRAVELLDMVGIPNAARESRSLPHEFSGGMRQRVMIAMALSCDPKILIADEPTTALDVTTQAQILERLHELRHELGMSLILITHDFGVIRGSVDRVAVMYAGSIVETADVEQIVSFPHHPYTVGLLDSVRRMSGGKERSLEPIPGTPPPPTAEFAGCPFVDRCVFALPQCSTEPPIRRESMTGDYLCWLPTPPPLTEIDKSESTVSRDTGRVLLTVENLTVSYGGGRRRRSKPAVDNVSFEIREGETLGLVGESGSGKSSTGRALMRLVPVAGGKIEYDGKDVRALSNRGYRSYAREVKLVFQDPAASLDPRFTVREAVEEPLLIHGIDRERERDERVHRILEKVGLGTGFLDRYPHELSGGQRQRVAVARALVLTPRLVVCDEPVSALDVSVQAQVINLLRDLRDDLKLTYLFISHDLRVVRYLADRIAVMQHGRIVEIGDTEQVYRNPQHSYTQQLLASIPEIDDEAADLPWSSKKEQPTTQGVAGA